MKTPDYIALTLDRLPRGYVFTYSDFLIEVNSREAVIKALNRLVQTGKIAKLSKGRYYKPESTPFGALQPNQTQVVKDLLEENGKITGYLTGYSIYNQLGLTTQVSNLIQIGKNRIRPGFKRERYAISFVLQKNTITRENVPLLQLLDAIRYIKRIPDATIESSCKRLGSMVGELSPSEKSTMVRLAMKYPPMVRALLGAMLEQREEKPLLEPLRKSLNPITNYKVKGADKALRYAAQWRIV